MKRFYHWLKQTETIDNPKSEQEQLTPMYYMTKRSNRGKGGIYLAIGLVVVVLLVAIIPLVSSYTSHHHVITLVNDKERVCSGGNNGTSCKYLVYTDHGTYRITDALIGTVRFNSSDVYGQVKRCHNYDIEYYGWRFGLFSSYPNIVHMKDLGVDKQCQADQ